MADGIKELSAKFEESQSAINKLQDLQKKNLLINLLQEEITKTTAELIACITEKDEEIKSLKSKNEELLKILKSKDKELSLIKSSNFTLFNLQQENLSLKNRLKYLISSKFLSTDTTQRNYVTTESPDSVKTTRTCNSSREINDELKPSSVNAMRKEIKSRTNLLESGLGKFLVAPPQLLTEDEKINIRNRKISLRINSISSELEEIDKGANKSDFASHGSSFRPVRIKNS